MSESRITRVGLGESVQAAIDKASAGDTIIFSLSEKRLIIDKPIHLMGAGMNIFGWRCGCVFYDDDGAQVLLGGGDDPDKPQPASAIDIDADMPPIDWDRWFDNENEAFNRIFREWFDDLITDARFFKRIREWSEHYGVPYPFKNSGLRECVDCGDEFFPSEKYTTQCALCAQVQGEYESN